ncbi:hypothetical protein T01_4669, partial [Trichinella spiralis]
LPTLPKGINELPLVGPAAEQVSQTTAHCPTRSTIASVWKCSQASANEEVGRSQGHLLLYVASHEGQWTIVHSSFHFAQHGAQFVRRCQTLA